MRCTILGKEKPNNSLFQILQYCLSISINTETDKKERQLFKILLIYTLPCQSLFQIIISTVIVLSCVMMVSYKLCRVEKHTEPVRILISCTDNSVDGTLFQASKYATTTQYCITIPPCCWKSVLLRSYTTGVQRSCSSTSM